GVQLIASASKSAMTHLSAATFFLGTSFAPKEVPEEKVTVIHKRGLVLSAEKKEKLYTSTLSICSLGRYSLA
ncbi:MAG: hypothetical protein ACE5LH_09290, partial [Fidelibacterota bacterium]